jgi:hypothetical protein
VRRLVRPRQRLLDSDGRDCVERGYLLIPVWLGQIASGDYEAGYETAAKAAAIGERFGDADLVWLARDDQACAREAGPAGRGVTARRRGARRRARRRAVAIVTGIVYCNTIAFCRDVYEVRHAREWTEALSRWCERQPEMVAHNGLCLVHRAEIMQLQGAWDDALVEARRAAERFTSGALNELARGRAFYQQGDVHRLRESSPPPKRRTGREQVRARAPARAGISAPGRGKAWAASARFDVS